MLNLIEYNDVLLLNNAQPIENLFLTEPTLQDIQQGSIGDCYLLAALRAIILRNPRYIRESIQEELFHVKVKFFIDGVPHWFRVQKTIPNDNEPNQPWVKIIEKAYAAWRVQMNIASGSTLYERLNHGFVSEAFRALLGTKTDILQIVSERFQRFGRFPNQPNSINAHLCNSSNPDNYFYEFYRDLQYILTQPNKSYAIIQHDTALIRIFLNPHQRDDFKNKSIDNYYVRNEQIKTNFYLIGEGANYYKILRQEKLLELFAIHYHGFLAEDTYQTLISHVIQHCPKKRSMTNAQNVNQHLLYERIKQELNSNNLICLGSYDVDSHAWCRNHRDQEIKGLVGGHFYNVVACCIWLGRKFVVLSNPWQAPYEREYFELQAQRLKARHHIDRAMEVDPPSIPIAGGVYEEIATGWNSEGHSPQQIMAELQQYLAMPNIFAVEISDITKRFDLMFVGTIPLPAV